jgi:DNA-binding transcriptional MerR regulator
MRVSELAERAGIAPSAVRWYESVGIIPAASRQPNGYREFAEEDLARLRLVVSLRRLGLGPEDAGRMARLCLEQGEVDRDLAPLIAHQRAAIARQRDDLDRLDGELIDLEGTIAAAGFGLEGAAQNQECHESWRLLSTIGIIQVARSGAHRPLSSRAYHTHGNGRSRHGNGRSMK